MSACRFVLMFAGFVGLSAGGFAAEPPVNRPPNIIHILADDLGYDEIGCYEAKDVKTPNLDRLAKEGMKFTSFYSPAPACSASRCAILTGCYAERLGLPIVLWPHSKVGLHENEVTIAELLKTKGYATSLIGKWHLGCQAQFLPNRHGFDHSFCIPYANDHEPESTSWINIPGNKDWRPPPMPLYRNGELVEEPADLPALPLRFTQEAIKFIKEHQDQPFFMHLAPIETHTPWFVSPRFMGVSQRGPYGDAIESLDWTIGQVLSTVFHLGLQDNTLIVFSSDNGPLTKLNPNTFELYRKYAQVDESRTHLLRGSKGTMWEGGVRVCCLMRWPGKIPAGSECQELAAGFDLYPTFAKVAGAEMPQDRKFDGKDILPLMTAQPSAKTPHNYFYYYQNFRLGAVRSGNWKLFFPPTPPGQKGKAGFAPAKPELYDLETDVAETKNVATDHADVVERLTVVARQAREDIGDSASSMTGKNRREPGKVEP